MKPYYYDGELEIARRKLASVRLLAEQIKRYTDWPGITDTAAYPEVVESLRVCAAGLVRALTPGPQGAAHAFTLPKAHVHHGHSDTLADCRADARRDGEPFTVALDPGDPAIDCPRCRLRLATDVLRPEEWCDRYGLIILDPDGWRTHDAPDWNEPVTLGVFHTLLATSTANAVATGAYSRIMADLARVRAAETADTSYRAIRREQHPEGGR